MKNTPSEQTPAGSRPAVGADLWALVIVLVLTSTASISYYLRIVVTIWVREADGTSVLTAVGDASGRRRGRMAHQFPPRS